MRKVFASLLAVGVLVLGGVAFALIQDSNAATAQEPPTEQDAPSDATDDTTTTRDRPARGFRAQVMDEVWDDLVADGVVTEDQVEQIKAAFAERLTELRAEFGDRQGQRGFRGFGRDLVGLLEDGVIDSDELAGLGEDHPLNDPEGPFADAAADGEITQEELEELRGTFGFHGPRGNPDDSTDTGESATEG